MKRLTVVGLVIVLNVVVGSSANRPNVILCMTDDQGWADTGYSGHPDIQTPHLDRMAQEGIRFQRFYAAAPVCSPTRGSCLTGRHPYRYGIVTANAGHMLPEEITLGELLQGQGYATGHFGKWHLGTLTKTLKESNRGGPKGIKHYSPPWDNGFDVCFSTEAKVPTWDPMLHPSSGEPYGTHYWSGPEQMVTENLEGDDSRVIMDRVLPFIEQAAQSKKTFLAVIWFHTPHKPVVAGRDYAARYGDHPGAQYLGTLTAMDEQMGRLRRCLRVQGVEENTMLWFCSDNGPEEGKDTPANGSAGILRGRKRSLYEGGVRVPGLLVWPAQIKQARRVDMPCCTSDYFPTVVDVLGLSLPQRPYDGVSLWPLIQGAMEQRPRPIGFESKNQMAWVDNRYKLYSKDKGASFALYDLINDPAETTDISADKPDIFQTQKQELLDWQASCTASRKQLLGG